MSRLILHVDLNAFYAAVEQRDHPEWRGRPLVVGAEPGQRGVVATCSYEARRFGVHSAMPIVQAVRRLPPETVYVRPSMARYAKVSQQIMGVLETVSPVDPHALTHPEGAHSGRRRPLSHRLVAVWAEPWPGRPVRLIGLGISGWPEADGGVQMDLFETGHPNPARNTTAWRRPLMPSATGLDRTPFGGD